MMKHYKYLEDVISKYYFNKGFIIKIEPHGSRGPDIVGENSAGMKIIGEIKNEKEIDRDLTGYWSQWNSDISFGGKTREYKLRDNYSDEGEGLNSPQNRGWASVIDGQLRGYCNKYQVEEGNLVVENINKYSKNLHDTLSYIKKQRRIIDYNIETGNNKIGIINIKYLYFQEDSMVNPVTTLRIVRIMPWRKIPWKDVIEYIPTIEERLREWAKIRQKDSDVSEFESQLKVVNETVNELVERNNDLAEIVRLVNLRLWWMIILFGAFIVYFIITNFF